MMTMAWPWPVDNNNTSDLRHLRHWLQFWQLKSWIHDNLCYLEIKSDTGQHSQFLRCFTLFAPQRHQNHLCLLLLLFPSQIQPVEVCPFPQKNYILETIQEGPFIGHCSFHLPLLPDRGSISQIKLQWSDFGRPGDSTELYTYGHGHSGLHGSWPWFRCHSGTAGCRKDTSQHQVKSFETKC